jgi:hypothetical protein
LTQPSSRATALVAALNDRSRTTIGNPWSGSYHVAIDVTDRRDTKQLLSELETLGAEAKLNLGYRDRIAIYDLDSFVRLRALGDLAEHVQTRLETLIRAKEPVPTVTREFIANRLAMRWSAERIAAELNRKRASRGMGGKGWTATKVRRVARGGEAGTRRRRAAA